MDEELEAWALAAGVDPSEWERIPTPPEHGLPGTYIYRRKEYHNG